jgi:hypothetical protein
MADPLIDQLAAKYGPIAAGLVIGTMAKYGLTLSEGQTVTLRGVLADLLMQGVLGLVAIAVSDLLGLTGNARVFVGALAALNSARLVSWARDTFFKRVQQQDLIGGIKATDAMATVPPGPASPAIGPGAAKLTVFRNADPRTAGVEALAEGPVPKNTAEFNELLDKLS